MLSRLDSLVDETGALQSKLILLVGRPGCGKTRLLAMLANRRGAKVMNVGAALGKRLAALPLRQRALQANVVMRELAQSYASGDLLLLDNIELLFDQMLKLDPLDLLKRHAKALRVVAVWPGELRDGRLIYAEMGHPEYQDYGLDGLVPFEIDKFAGSEFGRTECGPQGEPQGGGEQTVK
ncbi:MULTISPECIES: BREX-3 system P-loop-containing protein BrxF [Methylococcus]|uniref:BREX-3 system P-loop-containing protein BrxF n=1 Tax=Methylococcus capsulatus TaxID=414 RepID=A0ABZ2F774_METCP|nr:MULTISPECIES: BREX-3 system P-loop-containing protein BrxF [Methylococcus]MDF9393197.1 BREX-3 system P-loop-containing protein BrxF [Methylococcus capsulatus]